MAKRKAQSENLFWSKRRLRLHQHPRVLRIAARLPAEIPTQFRSHVAADAAMRVFDQVREHGKMIDNDDSLLEGMMLDLLDELAAVPGYGRLMADVGWAVEDSDGVRFPNFGKWNAPRTPAERMRASRNGRATVAQLPRNATETRVHRNCHAGATNVSPETETEDDVDVDADDVGKDVVIERVRDRAQRLWDSGGFALGDAVDADRSLLWKVAWLVEAGQISEDEFERVRESCFGGRRRKLGRPGAYLHAAMTAALSERSRPTNLNRLLALAPEPAPIAEAEAVA